MGRIWPLLVALLFATLLLLLYATVSPSALPLRRRRPSAAPYAPTTREIRLCGALRSEGIGAVLSGLKPVLLLANATGAVITTCRNLHSGHGYPLRHVLRLPPALPAPRIACPLPQPHLHRLLRQIVTDCAPPNRTFLRTHRLFHRCNLLTLTRYLQHPRVCLRRTAPLARALVKFPLHHNHTTSPAHKTHVCVLRRGGDVERAILAGSGNVWAIDEPRTIPVLRALVQRRATLVLVTETKQRAHVLALYRPHVFSNRESLYTVVRRLQHCRCLFVAAASSFAAAMVQIADPTFIVYMTNRTGFRFDDPPYVFSEYGRRAVPISTGVQQLARLCAP